jgi:hypothetical protein
VVSIPPGLKHCPLVVRKITKPFVFLEVSTTKGYKQAGEAVNPLLNPPEIAPAEKKTSNT